MPFLALDLEVRDPIEPETPGKDWTAARAGQLGVSVVGTYSDISSTYGLWDRHNFEALVEEIHGHELLVTFNGQEFDMPCLSGVLGYSPRVLGHYDILQEIWKALGGKVKGWGLGPVADRTLGVGKNDTGARASQLYMEGRFAELHTYCLHDVYLTKELFEHILREGYVVAPDGERLYLQPGAQA